MIEIGTLVRLKSDGDIGLVIKIIDDPMYALYWVKWSDGCEGDHLDFEMEIIA
jgi:hypothetical protein